MITNGNANTNPADFDWFDFEEDPTLPYAWSAVPAAATNQNISPDDHANKR
ncbi:hypothetical protein [Negadavirga shengliensis]|uniref:hypothetical protein n=1 Tax=Negadavirga shengliensis TaxID=1389218 RepID=UPI00366D9510